MAQRQMILCLACRIFWPHVYRKLSASCTVNSVTEWQIVQIVLTSNLSQMIRGPTERKPSTIPGRLSDNTHQDCSEHHVVGLTDEARRREQQTAHNNVSMPSAPMQVYCSQTSKRHEYGYGPTWFKHRGKSAPLQRSARGPT